MTERQQCTATTSRGRRCLNLSQRSGPLCALHHKRSTQQGALEHCQGLTSKGLSCKNQPISGAKYCRVHLKLCDQGIRQDDCKLHIKPKPCAAYLFEESKTSPCEGKVVKASKQGQYCSAHAHQYRLDKEDCSICMEPVDEKIQEPLQCGHWFHPDCLKGWKKPICPMCRTPMSSAEKTKYCPERSRNSALAIIEMHLALFESSIPEMAALPRPQRSHLCIDLSELCFQVIGAQVSGGIDEQAGNLFLERIVAVINALSSR